VLPAERHVAQAFSELEHGCKAIWVVYPEARLVEVHGASSQITIFKEDRALEGHDTLPGFSTPVSATFEGI
jgi:hypothetical protein